MTKKGKKTMTDKAVINIKNVDPEVLKKAKIMAIERGTTVSEILRELLKESVEDFEKEAKLKG